MLMCQWCNTYVQCNCSSNTGNIRVSHCRRRNKVYRISVSGEPNLLFLSVPGLSSDTKLDGVDELARLYYVLFGAPEFFCRHGSLGSVLCPPFVVQGAGLYNMLWSCKPVSLHGQLTVCESNNNDRRRCASKPITKVGCFFVFLFCNSFHSWSSSVLRPSWPRL